MAKTQHEKLAFRLTNILARLNSGERLNIRDLTDEFGVCERTISRDFSRLKPLLKWTEEKYPYYQLDRRSLGILTQEDIERFARFACISKLFPKIDRSFYAEKLLQEVQIKGLQYEDVSHLQKEFNCLKSAVENRRIILFSYKKNGENNPKFYQIAPYALLNKNGIWYLIGTDNGKQKTFCFSQMSLIRISEETFVPDEKLLKEIQTNDSISHGNQLNEVVIQVSKTAAPYFLRRNLLPNQELVHQLDDGGLILASKNINEMDIIPLVQYWIPHLVVISPNYLQEKLIDKLKIYVSSVRN